MFEYGLIFGGRNCLHATSQKRALSHAISLAVNYHFPTVTFPIGSMGIMITSC